MSRNYSRNRHVRETPKSAHRINKYVKAPEVRLINSEGEMLGVFKVAQALSKAEELGLDLVEVVPNSTPPVCRLIDYGKFLYQQEKKQKEIKKHQKGSQLKEIKLRPKTDVHDYNFKIKHVRQFLQHGDKVKITIRFRGREMAFQDIGRERMEQVIEDTRDLAKPESKNRMQGRDLSTILTPLVLPSKNVPKTNKAQTMTNNDKQWQTTPKAEPKETEQRKDQATQPTSPSPETLEKTDDAN